MDRLSPLYFFDLANSQHASLFTGIKFVWEALPRISGYLKTLKLGKIEAEIPRGAYLINADLISIGKGSVVEPGAYIKGPCFIGENCTIRHGAYIRGDVLAGNGCVIGHTTELKNVMMLDNVHAAHFAYVGDSILGNNVNLGAGTKCANLKLKGDQVLLRYKGQTIETGLRKFGAIIGDGCQTGCNSVMNPGTLFGKNVYCYPCVNCGGFVEENTLVKSSMQIITSSL